MMKNANTFVWLLLCTLNSERERSVPPADPVVSIAHINAIIRLVEGLKSQERTIYLHLLGGQSIFLIPRVSRGPVGKRERERLHIQRFEI